ncbi:uncharacterized protein TNCV_655941 [Trichonephila clavipes]|nr:uncharacterized protein TNCV_655941 [Trichonephila clavipes]
MLFPDIHQKLGIPNYMPTGNSSKVALLYHVRPPCLDLGLPPYTIITSFIERWQSIKPTIAPHTIKPAVGAVCRCKAKAGLRRSPWGLHARTRLSSLLRWNLDSSLKTTWFHSTAVQFYRARHHSKRRRRLLGIKGSTRNERRDPECPSARHLRMVEKTQGPLMKVLPVPGWRPMKQLAVRVHFLRCGGLLDDFPNEPKRTINGKRDDPVTDWSEEGVLSLVFV